MRLFLFSILLCFVSTLYSQSNEDSLIHELIQAKHDTSKLNLLIQLGSINKWNQPKKAIDYCLAGLPIAQKLNDKRKMVRLYYHLGEALAVSGNFALATDIKFKSRTIAEELKDDYLIGWTTTGIAAGFFYQGDYGKCIEYTKKAMSQTSYYKSSGMKELHNGFLGESYYEMGKLDSALFHTQIAYEIQLVDGFKWSVPYFVLGNIYAKRNDLVQALWYYRKGLGVNPARKDSIDGHIAMAKVFSQTEQNDSALFYARKAINEGKQYSFLTEVASALTVAKDLFKKMGSNDSAFYYQELMVAAKDSLFNQEKMKQVQSLAINEQLRQQEAEAQKIKDAEEREHNLQYAAIAFGLISFIILFLLFSHSIIANQKMIRFLGIIALLIVFEFINLFLHPFIASWTHHSPLLMLLIMVCIAALLVPAHHYLEKWVTQQLVEKNKRIRLAAAKNIIAKLETEKTGS